MPHRFRKATIAVALFLIFSASQVVLAQGSQSSAAGAGGLFSLVSAATVTLVTNSQAPTTVNQTPPPCAPRGRNPSPGTPRGPCTR